MRDCEEMVRRMKPVASKLEIFSEEIMTTGETGRYTRYRCSDHY